MLKNYFKTAWRTIVRSKGYSALNIFGLAMGMAVALLIGLWVYNEYSFDKFLPDYQRAYLVRRNYYGNGDTVNYNGSSLKLADALRDQVPEMQYVAETDYMRSHGLLVGNKKLYMAGSHVAGDFLKIFPFPLVKGNAAAVLADPYSIVLTESTAKALFGPEDPMGKAVRFDNKDNLKVTGILKDLPANSSFKFNYLVPFAYLEANDEFTHSARHMNFEWNGFQTYVQLKPGVSYDKVAAKIRDIEKVDKDNIMSVVTNVILQPMQNWHLYGNYENGKETGGFVEYVRMFAIIGVLVLLIACINFVNITTARSEKRAREVGVRKAIGSRRKDLVIQFLTESLLLTAIAFLLSLLLVQLALPALNNLTGTDIRIPFSSGAFWLVLTGAVLVTALTAGSRPAFYLSSFNPVQVLKGTKAARTSALPRKILVVLQFSCSVALIISAFIIYQQIQYARNRPAGYDLNRLVMTNMNSDLAHNYTAIKNELLQKGIAESVTWASSPATRSGWHRDVDDWPGKRPGETVNMGRISISEGYFATLGMTMKEGRDFSGSGDTLNVIFNEAAVRLLRLKNPLHQVITNWKTKMQIIGIVKDALTVSPYQPADPTMFLYDPNPQGTMMYRLSPRLPAHEAVAQLTAIFSKYNPAFPYEYQFADASYARTFDTEVLIGKLAALIAGMAIFISCLGLFGLAAYMAERRTKEIGIRKVLGASIGQLWFQLSKEFIVLVLISCVIASPIALYFLRSWLQKYPYRIQIGADVFLAAGLIAMAITLVTISFQSIRAAVMNPVESLRSE
ncbi:ABC transporter permease [Puia sp.]|jgi:ABC-type antimicrobial peptide transport system permease subunit|uniref:ABC transporter permease n=1 Tax=Puia sp. TaxID=2045100 RepID=UPI002F4197AE